MRCSSWCGDITPNFFSTRATHDGKNLHGHFNKIQYHGEVESTENSHVFFYQKTPREADLLIFFTRVFVPRDFSTWFHGSFYFQTICLSDFPIYVDFTTRKPKHCRPLKWM